MAKSAEVAVNSVQVSLAFNRLVNERKLRTLLSRGCVTAAIQEIDFSEDQETRLIAEFFKEDKIDEEARRYVADRDPGLVTALPTFKSKYGSTWEEPACEH